MASTEESRPWFDAFLYSCRLVPSLPLSVACVYCLALSISYVGSLYVLAPSRIRRLPRDDRRQIQHRSLAAVLVSIAAVLLFPWQFCQRVREDENILWHNSLAQIGSVVLREFQPVVGVLVHTLILFLGPIVQLLMDLIWALQAQNKQLISAIDVVVTLYAIYLEPLVETMAKLFAGKFDQVDWKIVRNLIVAPWTEEVVFRSYMVSVLAMTNLGTVSVFLLAPIFFGLAHGHHAWLRCQQGEHWLQVLPPTLFQFAYTTIFGSYASWVFWRTRSVLAITVSHSLCNAMGLPNLVFLHESSPLFEHRRLLLSLHGLGLIVFLCTLLSPLMIQPVKP